MSDGNEINLRPIWDALLDVFEVFRALCDKHGLVYMADTGTALGAIRHGGFIPWDDDLDVQMPREDYEKFIKIAKEELPRDYAWLDRHNCPDFKYGFGKVIITNERILNQVSKESGSTLPQGLFIDIFPLDGYPDSAVAVKWRKIQNYLVSLRGVFNDGYSKCCTSRAKFAWCVAALISPFNYKFKDSRDIVDFWEKRALKYKYGTTNQCVSIGLSLYSDDKPYPSSYVGKIRKVKFDKTEINVQEKAEEYLTSMFGDYMKLPPVEKRCSAHVTSSLQPWRLGPNYVD